MSVNQRRRRRYLTRRNALIGSVVIVAGGLLLVLSLLLVYRLGYVDSYLAGQIKRTFANYGIRAEIKEFHTGFTPQTVEMLDVELYDAMTGEKLGRIDRLLAAVRIEDLYALSLKRNINLKHLALEGLEVWVSFDELGRSNFRNIHIPPPEPNRRILFAYSTAQLELKNGVVHYGDIRHEISGEARNLNATIQPDDPSAPTESWMNTVNLSVSDSTFTYDGRQVKNIGIEARGRVNQMRADLEELVLRSPLAEARLQGSMDDWRSLRYQMNITSTVDLIQLSDLLQSETTLSGTGNFVGTVTGEGERYKIEGTIKSDTLAADGVRLQGLSVTSTAEGEGKSYEAKGRAVADLLTTGDFQLNTVQVVGGVMGTGSDFRWLGELRATAAKAYGTNIVGLILRDARAELSDDSFRISSSQFTANGLSRGDTDVKGITASDLQLRNENNAINGSIESIKTGNIVVPGAQIDAVTAKNIDINGKDGNSDVVVKEVEVGAVKGPQVEVGNFNIAGVRFSVRNGRIQGSTADISVGSVKLADDQVDDVKLTKPVFLVEPSGRYRASADLSIGGGVLGRMNLGQAQANLVLTNSDVQLGNFTADIFHGRAKGTAKIALNKGANSQIQVEFADLDVAGPLTALTGAAVPISGRASGRLDLSFLGTDLAGASGTVATKFAAETSPTESDRVPVTGEVSLRADRGLFQIEELDIQTPATTFKASGQFSFTRDSNLQVDLVSSNANELQTILISSGLMPEIEDQLTIYGIGLAGELAFKGNIRGSLKTPDLIGTISLGSLLVNGHDLGSLSASITKTAAELRIDDGRLVERDGGGMQFSLHGPGDAKENIDLEATLDRMNAASLIAAIPASRSLGPVQTTQADVSGRVKISGIPKTMSGSADLRVGAGRLAGEPLESLLVRATFSGSTVNVESIDARLDAGRIVASVNFDTVSKLFEGQGRAENFQLSRVAAWAGKSGLLNVSGVADFNARVSGKLSDTNAPTYDITLDGKGKDVIINGESVGTFSVEGRTENNLLTVTLTTGILGPAQTTTAQVDLASDGLPTRLETTLNNADLTTIFKIALPQNTIRLTGRATGKITANGNLLDEDGSPSIAGLQGEANFSALSFRVEDVQLNANAPLVVRFSPKEISFDPTQLTGPGTNISLGGTLAMGPGGKESLVVDGRLNLRILNGLSPDVFTSGTGDVSIRLTGTYEQPRLNGTASLTGSSVSILLGNDRWTVSNLKSVVRFTSNQAQIESFAGTMGGGRVSASGGARLEGLSIAEFLVRVRGENVTVPYPENFRSTADADLEIKGSSREQLLSGVVNVRRAEYTKDIELADLINFRGEESIEEGGELEITQAAYFSDLRVEGRNALVVRNNLANLVGSVSLQINGPVKDPAIAGRITAGSGTLNFRNDRYEIVRALMDLPTNRNADPIINIQAESQIRGYRVTVSLSGPLSQPRAVVHSDPPLPQADVVALITTGQLSTGDTTASVLSQSALGTATSLLTDALINAPAQRATNKLFGLTRFEINPVIGGRSGSTPGARLTLGRQINRNLSVTYSTNVTSDPNQILAIEYRVSDRISFIAQYEQASTQQLTSRKNSFSFEIRFRKRF